MIDSDLGGWLGEGRERERDDNDNDNDNDNNALFISKIHDMKITCNVRKGNKKSITTTR